MPQSTVTTRETPSSAMPGDVGAELAEGQHGEGGRADPVDVVVAVDADLLAGRDGGDDPLHCDRCVAQQERVVPGLLAGQEPPRRSRIAAPASNEHRGSDLAYAELGGERSHGLPRARTDRPAARLHRRRGYERGRTDPSYVLSPRSCRPRTS
jgi:hypothetical protein